MPGHEIFITFSLLSSASTWHRTTKITTNYKHFVLQECIITIEDCILPLPQDVKLIQKDLTDTHEMKLILEKKYQNDLLTVKLYEVNSHINKL